MLIFIKVVMMMRTMMMVLMMMMIIDEMFTNTFGKELQANLLPSHSKDIYLKKMMIMTMMMSMRMMMLIGTFKVTTI